MGNGERDNALRRPTETVTAEAERLTQAARSTVLQEAAEVIQERGESYGHPALNHSCTASLISTFLSRKYGKEITLDAEDVCWFNVLQKVSREANTPKHDNLVDVAGFVENIDMMRNGLP